VIEISLDREEAINLDIEVGALGPMYEDTQCNMDVGPPTNGVIYIICSKRRPIQSSLLFLVKKI
jgi:hypothetical protein